MRGRGRNKESMLFLRDHGGGGTLFPLVSVDPLGLRNNITFTHNKMNDDTVKTVCISAADGPTDCQSNLINEVLIRGF